MSYIMSRGFSQSGNLASQIQQYASLYAIAKKTGKQLVFPQSTTYTNLETSPPSYGLKFADLFDLELQVLPDESLNDFITYELEHKLVDDNVFNLDNNTNYNIAGLLHSYKYWYQECGDYMSSLKWSTRYSYLAQQKYLQLVPNDKEIVSIHVRRGDYLLQHCQQTFCILDNSYYSEAVSLFVNELDKYHFLVFSNDIDYCKDNLIDGDMVTFVEQGIDYVDLIVMSMCHHNIIANSSYSWWAAFFNKNNNKKIICPSNYIKSTSPFAIINKQYYPPSWINIDNEA